MPSAAAQVADSRTRVASSMCCPALPRRAPRLRDGRRRLLRLQRGAWESDLGPGRRQPQCTGWRTGAADGGRLAAMDGPASLHGVPVAVAADLVDRHEAQHRFVAAGPFLRCLEHMGTLERDNVADALAALSHARTCERYRTAWQRLMLADDESFTPVVRSLPKPLLAYLRDQ